MEFTYNSYNNLINSLKEHGYHFCDYHDYSNYDKCVVLRHDIDNDPCKALKMAEVEHRGGGKKHLFCFVDE